MKKFILCICLGYLLIFVLFIGLPQMMDKNPKQSLFPRGAEAVPASIRPESPAAQENAQDRLNGPQRQAAEPVEKDKTLDEKKKAGPIETFYRSGTLSSEWAAGEEEGTGVFKIYTPEGLLWFEKPFRKKKPEGDFVEYYAAGIVFSTETFREGEPGGRIQWFYPNGQKWLELEVQPDQGLRLTALYSENGGRADQPAVQAEQTGYFKAYDESGREVFNWQQAGGEQAATLKSYYESGQVSSVWNLEKGSLQGKASRYYADGALWEETEFEEGRRKGRRAQYRPDGSLILEREPLELPQAGMEERAYYPDGRVFWILTHRLDPDMPAFKLNAFWQEEPESEEEKEKVIL